MGNNSSLMGVLVTTALGVGRMEQGSPTQFPAERACVRE